jgi:predicted house-cleaning noncanonical NTP pyrophosphatase (MazG superfamily)
MVEVIYAILAVKGVSVDEFEVARLKKQTDRGGFEKRLFLESVKD